MKRSPSQVYRKPACDRADLSRAQPDRIYSAEAFAGVRGPGDDRYVRELMKRGGLARSELVDGRRVLFGPDGGPWREVVV